MALQLARWTARRSMVNCGMSLAPMKVSKGANAKLGGGAARIEMVRRQNATFLAFVDVAKDGYVPSGLHVRERLQPRTFTADIPVSMLDVLLADDDIVLITPSTEIGPAS